MQDFERFFRHAQQIERYAGIFLVQDTHHDAFASAARQGRHTHIDKLATQRQADAAILRNAAFSDVEARHDLDTANNDWRDIGRQAEAFLQHAVGAHANDKARFIWLDVNIGYALADSLSNDAVD